MATVVTPHAANHSAMAVRSQEFAPNWRMFAGKSSDAPSAWGNTRLAGTQTMCMSECTSMPAALGLRTASVTACSRGDRDRAFGGLSALAGLTLDDLASEAERLRCFMVSATLLE